MPNRADKHLRGYLQARAKAWLLEKGHTVRGLARLAHLSPPQISDAVNKGQIGMKTMTGLMGVFGLTLGTLDEEARRWAAAQPEEKAPVSERRGVFARLVERPEWLDVARRTAEEYGDLDVEDIARVGQLPDDELTFAGPLDVPTVAGLAAVLRARHQRLERRKTQGA